MTFNEGYEYMLLGEKIALPDWKGYWYWDKEKKTIIIHSGDGSEIDIRETNNVHETMSNILTFGWEIARTIPVIVDVYITVIPVPVSSPERFVLKVLRNGVDERFTTRTSSEAVNIIKDMYQSPTMQIYLDCRGYGKTLGKRLTAVNISYKKIISESDFQ